MLHTFRCLCLLLQSLTPEVIEHAQAGAAEQQQGHFDVAIQEFRKVTELQPNSASGYANLGNAYFQKGDYGAAIPELQHALQLNPKLTGTHEALGVALLLQGDAAGALPHLEETRSPELLGLAYLETGKLGGAIAALKAALEKQPSDPDLLYYFGRATARAGAGTFAQLVKMNPELARKKEAAGNSEQHTLKDVGSLQAALAKQPNDPDLLFDFHRAAEVASKEAFNRILESNAGSARAHQVMAERWVEAGRLPDAVKEYAESLRLRPYTAGVHLALGDVLADEGNWPAAIAQYRIETSLRPADAEASYSLGTALLQQRQASESLSELGRADRLAPNKPAILLALGQAAFAAKDNARAEQAWRKVLELDEKSGLAARAHRGLAELYRNTGNAAEADREQAAYQKLKTQGEH